MFYIFLSLACSSYATSVVDSSIANGNWSSPTTWHNGRVPHDSDYVVVNTYVTLDENVTISYPGGGALYITANGDLCGPYTFNGELINYGKFEADTLIWQGNSFNYATIMLVDLGRSGVNPCSLSNISPGTICVGCPISCAPLTPPTANFNGVQSTCTGNVVNFTDESTGLPSNWLWLFPGGTPSSSNLQNPTVTYYDSGTYTVTLIVSNAAGSDTAVKTIRINPSPAACCDSVIAFGGSVQLTTTNAVSYLWAPSAGLSCTNCPDPIASPQFTTTYTCTMVSDSGCALSQPITIDVLCGTVFVPDAFSPNNDGQNDCLYVRGDCIKTLDFMVFDRWGNKVFETTDKSIPWNGQCRGEAMNTGSYVYYLNATFYDGTTQTKKGNVALVR